MSCPCFLTRFLDNKDDIAKVRKCFAGLWSLDDTEVILDAIEKPELYVMKPQREGGGTTTCSLADFITCFICVCVCVCDLQVVILDHLFLKETTFTEMM